ncbi:transporter substrate-binding domain-containing protein [Peribacillus asahii]|uniref:transporter substrate-binding domain-containing protein n=1 Tax=Peribacillus asahii TaxID=228899 RepID=UPI00381F1037
MRIVFLCLLIILLQGIGSISSGFAEEKVYKIAAEPKLPPFSYINENGVLTGLSIDLMEQIAEQHGLSFEYIPMNIEDAEKALEEGKVDAIAGMVYRPDKDWKFDFSTSYFTMSDSIVISKERKNQIKGLEDLENRQIVVEGHTSMYENILNMRTTNVLLEDNQYTALQSLIEGRADIFIGNKWTATAYLKELGKEESFIILDDVMNSSDYAVVVQEGNNSLLLAFNQSITMLEAKGELNKLMNKWTVPKDLTEIARLETFIYLLMSGLIIVALVLFIIYMWNQRLKAAVHTQTSKLRQLNENLQETQQIIADSNAFKDLILNNIDTGIVTFNVDLTITSCNASALHMLNLSNDTPFGLQNPPLLKQLFDHYHSKESGVQVFEWNEQGQKKVIYYRILQIYNSQEQQTGYLLSMNDETEKKNLEQKLFTQEKLHALGQLVAGVAHEIRNPLTSIKMFIDMLPSKYHLPEFRRLITEHVPSEVNRLNTIVTDLVEYARPRPSNKQKYTLKEMASLLSFIQVTMDKNQISLEKKMEDNLVFYIDSQQIRQVMINLLLNAVDAVAEKEEKKITITVKKINEEIGSVMISDTGKGMSSEELHHILEPFYTSKEKGVGLGLTLTYNLIKENKGELHITSQPNKGSTFTILLPLYQKEAS